MTKTQKERRGSIGVETYMSVYTRTRVKNLSVLYIIVSLYHRDKFLYCTIPSFCLRTGRVGQWVSITVKHIRLDQVCGTIV